MRKGRERRWSSHLLSLYKASTTRDAVKSSRWRVGGHGWFWWQLPFTSLCLAGEYGLTFMGPEARAPKAVIIFLANARVLWSLVPFHDWQMTPSPRQLELLPSAHRQAVNDLTKEMVSGRGHQVGEKRRWTCLPCAPGLAGEGLWVSSNTIKLERIKELRVDPSAAPADILSLKHIFFWMPEIKRKFRNAILKFMNHCSWKMDFWKIPLMAFKRLWITLYYSWKISWVFHVKYLVLLQRDRELRLIELILCAGHNGPFTLVCLLQSYPGRQRWEWPPWGGTCS